MADAVDWELAASTGARLASPGPGLSREEARAVVAELREAAAEAIAPVARATGLDCPPGTSQTVVVDRPAWVRSAVDGFRAVAGPAMLARTGPDPSEIGSRVVALQLGTALSWLSTKVLGQYEAFALEGQSPRLLLVAPNICSVERSLDLVPRDFRLWVAMHEETHRVQFGAVPWLGHHLRAEIEALIEAADVGAADLAARLVRAAREVASGGSLVEAAQSPEQRAVLDRLTALMALLEGHADHAMDVAADGMIPSLPTIRARFDERRARASGLDGLLRRLIGLDAKLRQYTDGAAFVRSVVDAVGVPGFNAVWRSPDTLPTLAEIHDPAAWVARTAPYRDAGEGPAG